MTGIAEMFRAPSADVAGAEPFPAELGATVDSIFQQATGCDPRTGERVASEDSDRAPAERFNDVKTASCGKGWAHRCATSKGKRCRCKCGGANHGSARQGAPLPGETAPQPTTDRHARYTIVMDAPCGMVLRDVGPHDRHLSVTNDAEHVVRGLAPRLGNRPLYYFDTDGRLDEMRHDRGQFLYFMAGAPDTIRAQLGVLV